MADFFKETVDNLGLGVCGVDKEKKITYWNKGAEEIVGFCFDEIKNKKFEFFEDCSLIDMALKDGILREGNSLLYNKNNKEKNVSYKIISNKNENGEIIGATIMFHDITSNIEMIKRINELQEVASIDFLTKLPNRRMLEKNLNLAFEEMRREGKKFGIIFMDIDNFKMVNDKYGHEIGDFVLKTVVARLIRALRPYDILGRWGGDEFVALIKNTDIIKVYAIASRIRSVIDRMSLFTGEYVIKVTLSIGAVIANDNDNINSIIARADKMMYKSKISGKNKVTIEM